MSSDPFMTDLLNRAVATLEPHTEVLLAGGLARGRSLRRRRRLAQGASGVALATLIATVTVAVWPASGSASHQRAVATGPSPTAQTTPPPASAPDTGTVTPQVVAQRSFDLLPSGTTTTDRHGNAMDGSVGAQFVYHDGHGAAKIDVSLDFGPTSGGLGEACQISTCTTRADGSTLAVRQGSDDPGNPAAEPKQWSVLLQRTDGVTITFSEWNAPAEKGAAAVTRATPPLSLAAATAFVTSDTWQVQVPASEITADAGLFTPASTDDPQPAPNAKFASMAARARARAESDARRAAARAAKHAGH